MKKIEIGDEVFVVIDTWLLKEPDYFAFISVRDLPGTIQGAGIFSAKVAGIVYPNRLSHLVKTGDPIEESIYMLNVPGHGVVGVSREFICYTFKEAQERLD